jgi:hypothetical protein
LTFPLTVKHLEAIAALPADKDQNVPVKRQNPSVNPHSMTAKQTFVLNVPTAKMNDSSAMASKKNANEAANSGASSPADGSLVL